MTETAALLLALMESAESERPCFTLEIGVPVFDLDDLVLRRTVYVNGVTAFHVDTNDFADTSIDVDRLARFVRIV